MANARLGWFSPLGVAVSIRASARRVGLRGHRFRFSACAASEWLLGELVLPPSASEIALGGLAFGLPLPLFGMRRFGDCRSASWPSGSLLPLFGMRHFGVAARWVGLRAHSFRFSARTASGLPSASWRFCSAGWFFCLPLRGCPRRVGASAFRFGDCCSAGWPSGSPLPLFGMRQSAPPHRRNEDRRSTPTRHLFHFKTLIPTC